MTLLRKWAFWLLLAFLAVIALLVAADNSAEVPLTFLDYESMALPISWWMLGAFVAGVLFGTLLNLVSNTRLRLDARQARRELERSRGQLDRERADKAARAADVDNV